MARLAYLVATASAVAAGLTGCRSGEPTHVPPDVAATPSTARAVIPESVPLLVSDAAQVAPPRAPEPSADLPCGSVDRLDFPLGPPDGQGFGARWIFGRNSRRYRQIHAGEDWTALSGASLGQPVHAIGHGIVTYANPYGWGATDKGVVIVRHRLPDGADRLSLYGHLEPSSITIDKGACVARGELVGRVGKPRGAPHLHFEIRTHLPDQPGPGYWPTDPTRAGWDPPSETILTWRDRLHPAVARVIPMTNSVAIGALGDDVLVDHQGAVVALKVDKSIESAAESWRLEVDSAAATPVLDQAARLLYITRAGQDGVELSAIRVPPDGSEPLWTSDLPGMVVSAAAALAELGGVTLVGDGWVRRYDSAGHYVGAAVPRGLTSAFEAGERTVVATKDGAGDVWVMDGDGTLRGPLLPGGLPAPAGEDGLWLLRPEGLYLAELATLRARRVAAMDAGPFKTGAIAGLPDGGALALRRGLGSWELVRLMPDGTVAWLRELDRSQVQAPEILLVTGAPYLVTRAGDVLGVDVNTGAATRIYRAARGGAIARASSAGGRLLIEAGGPYAITMEPHHGGLDAALD